MNEPLPQKGKMFDILGYYFDSSEPDFSKVEEKLSFSLLMTVTGVSSHAGCEVQWKFEVEKDNKVSGVAGKSLLSICNQFIPNFVLIDQRYNNNVHRGEGFDVSCKYEGKAVLDYKRIDLDNSGIEFSKAIAKIIGDKGHVPLVLKLDYEVARHTNVETRLKYLEQKRGGKTPEKFFTNACSHEFDQATIGSHHMVSSYRRRNAFRGDVKKHIYSMGHKDNTVFAIEYLYGVKLPKSSTYRQIFDKFAAQPYNDFGVKDVQVMQKLVDVLSTNQWQDKRKLYEELQKTGVKPVTNLSRWQKDIQPKTLVTNEVPF